MNVGASIIAPVTVLRIGGGVRALFKRCLIVLLKVDAAVKMPIRSAASASWEGTCRRGRGRARLPYAADTSAFFFLAADFSFPLPAWGAKLPYAAMSSAGALGKKVERIFARFAPVVVALVASVGAAAGFVG